MKIKANIRAGKQTRNRGSDNPVETEVETEVEVYVPPVSRCVGI
ncbi:MAG: hypothetical protein AB7Q81_09750 [Gammaproteobacteria bacterium]